MPRGKKIIIEIDARMKIAQERKSQTQKETNRRETINMRQEAENKKDDGEVFIFILYFMCRLPRSKNIKQCHRHIHALTYSVCSPNFWQKSLRVDVCMYEGGYGYVFLIEKETNAHTLMPIKIHLVLLTEIDNSLDTFLPLMHPCWELCEFNQDENGIAKRTNKQVLANNNNKAERKNEMQKSVCVGVSVSRCFGVSVDVCVYVWCFHQKWRLTCKARERDVDEENGTMARPK